MAPPRRIGQLILGLKLHEQWLKLTCHTDCRMGFDKEIIFQRLAGMMNPSVVEDRCLIHGCHFTNGDDYAGHVSSP
jgi:hypothetical protein